LPLGRAVRVCLNNELGQADVAAASHRPFMIAATLAGMPCNVALMENLKLLSLFKMGIYSLAVKTWVHLYLIKTIPIRQWTVESQHMLLPL